MSYDATSFIEIGSESMKKATTKNGSSHELQRGRQTVQKGAKLPQQGAPEANVTPLHSNSPTYKEVAVQQLSTETSIVLAVGL